MPEYGNTGAQTVSTPLLSGGIAIGKGRSGPPGSVAPGYRSADVDNSGRSAGLSPVERFIAHNPMPNSQLNKNRPQFIKRQLTMPA
jgi:hypothetical protein